MDVSTEFGLLFVLEIGVEHAENAESAKNKIKNPVMIAVKEFSKLFMRFYSRFY